MRFNEIGTEIGDIGTEIGDIGTEVGDIGTEIGDTGTEIRDIGISRNGKYSLKICTGFSKCRECRTLKIFGIDMD